MNKKRYIIPAIVNVRIETNSLLTASDYEQKMVKGGDVITDNDDDDSNIITTEDEIW